MDEEQERALAEAAPLLRDLHDGWHAAAAKYATYPEDVVAEHNDTTAANCVRSHMFHEVMRRFGERRGCTVRDIRGFKVLVFGNSQVWRFKKVDAAGRHAAYPTPQQQDFDDQWPLQGIPDSALRLTSGYMLDPAGRVMERIVVSRVLGRTVRWLAQTVVVDGAMDVRDITPARLGGTGRVDWDAEAARRRRGRR